MRSNQYADRVIVDGVQYGSTPVAEVLMPVGKHHIIIEKEGYRSFNSEIEVTADQTLRAVLNEYENVLKPGHKFTDSLKGNAKAPEMITDKRRISAGWKKLPDKFALIMLSH